MKAGNEQRVVLTSGGVPWAVGLGHDAKAEHTGVCRLLMDCLGIEEHPVPVADACWRAMAPGGDWGLATPADPRAASVLYLSSGYGASWGTKRPGLHLRHLQGGERPFYGVQQDDDALVTAWDNRSAALAAFRIAARRLLADIAEALGKGRVAVLEGHAVGPMFVLPERVPGDRFCQAIAVMASALSFDDEGTGIAYAEHRPEHLERCVPSQPIR